MEKFINREEERDRYRELLEELRTIIPGAQVLFAFLLTAPFAARFSLVDLTGQVMFTISLVAVAIATILFLAPTAYHRLADRTDYGGRIRFGVRTTLAGMFLLGLSITLAVYVVVRYLFDNSILAIAMAGATTVLAFTTWYLLPVRNRKRRRGRSESQTDS